MLKNNLIQFFQDEATEKHELSCAMLRIDLLHPVVSGNKIFKLNHYLKEAISKKKRGIVTFGGYHSNHLVASAYAAKQSNLESIGIVRGEKPNYLSHTLNDCISYEMELKFSTRQEFDSINIENIKNAYPDHLVIQQGGYGKPGMLGAMDILRIDGTEKFDFIMAACGTGTMGAGLISAASLNQKIILLSVLKDNFSILDEVNALIDDAGINPSAFEILFDFHLGGYAKQHQQLFECMNTFYGKHQIPTDFVYTGKMIYGFYQLAASNFFPKKSKILLVHSGGLQGNRSLTENQLIFC
ncbi:MAG: 1-aminocyclopropane-1-carboxylate deaminase/D-cysteine desulfhydrase [bacterium]|jgi:1-aminocyclopropane-1-carboxylate deaminase